MVKFSLLALAGAIATATAAKHNRTIKLGNRQLRRGDASTEALLKKARPYKKAGAATRKLEQEEKELDGSYSVKFSQCVDVRTKNEDLFDENTIALAQSGSVISSKSYVLFHVCQGNNCYYESDEDLYIVDLATYLANVATYHADQRQNYCEACERFEETCNPEEEVEEEVAEEEVAEEEAVEEEGEPEDEGAEEGEPEQEGEGQEAEGDEPDRKLKKTSRRTKNYIDCDQCKAYGCYQEEVGEDDVAQQEANAQNNMDELDRQVSEWIAGLGECQRVENNNNNNNGNNNGNNNVDLYIGAICSSYGDGVELAVFLDEECSLYTNQYTFNSVYNPDYDANEINYVMYAENYIKTAFEETMSCLEMEFDDPNEEQNENANEEEEERYEMNEYCEGLLNDDALDYTQCQYGNGEEEQQQEENQDDQYNWYTYDIENADNIEEVCQVVAKMEGEFYHVYDETSSGTWYTRDRNGHIVTVSSQNGQGAGLSGGAIAAIVLVCVGVVGVAAFLLKPKKKSDSNTPVYQGGTML